MCNLPSFLNGALCRLKMPSTTRTQINPRQTVQRASRPRNRKARELQATRETSPYDAAFLSLISINRHVIPRAQLLPIYCYDPQPTLELQLQQLYRRLQHSRSMRVTKSQRRRPDGIREISQPIPTQPLYPFRNFSRCVRPF